MPPTPRSSITTTTRDKRMVLSDTKMNVATLARSKITLKKIFHHPNTKKCSFLCNKRGSKKNFPIFLLLGLVQGPPKYIPSKKIEIFEGAPWSPPSMKKMFIFNKKGPFLCYKIFPLIFFPNFFTIGCLGGGLKKYIFFNFFEGVEKIRIALNHP